MSKVSVIVPVYNMENYIEDMLMSIQYQTMTDFEVILVNDGSMDGTQKILERFCSADGRFRCFVKARGGLSSACNMGISKASGEYTVFFYPEDHIPHDSLEKMYRTAVRYDADIVAGNLCRRYLGKVSEDAASAKLAKQKKIDPLDRSFFRAWELRSKMFSTSFLHRNRMRFEKTGAAEEGIFLFCALNHTDRVYGCDTDAYEYIKRAPWEHNGDERIIDEQYIRDLADSHERMIQEALRLAGRRLGRKRRKHYMENLYAGFIEDDLIGGCYRRIWNAHDYVVQMLVELTARYRDHTGRERWEKILKRCSDIDLKKGLKKVPAIISSPKVSVILSADEPPKNINMMLASIYGQNFPLFEVIVPAETYRKAERRYEKMPNLRTIEGINGSSFKEEALRSARGGYILLLDEFVMFSENSLRIMVNRLDSSEDTDFVSMLLKTYDEEGYHPIPCLNAAYGCTRRTAVRNTRMTMYDVFFSNKLFRKNVLEDFVFGTDKVRDIRKMYRSLNFEKLRNGIMITDMKETEIISRSGARLSRVSVKLGYARTEAARRIAGKLKLTSAREDTDDIKR